MLTFCKAVKSIHQHTKDSVFGYIRRYQNILGQDKVIAPLIYHPCLSYFHIKEYWTAYHPKLCELNEDKSIVTHTYGDERLSPSSIYGNILTKRDSPSIYKWKFKIIKNADGRGKCLYLGIDSSKKKYIADDYSWDNEYHHYAFGDGNKYSLDTVETEYGTEEYRGFYDGDLVEMELNTKKKTIKIYINGNDQGTAFDDVDIDREYNMGITLSQKDTSVQIVEFKHIYLE